MKNKYTYEIVAFISGGMCMIIELVASRILSPYLGSSNLIWTCIIGMMLAFMSLGYFVGGKISDKYPNKNIWVWSGFKFDDDLKGKEVLNYIDVLVDGRYSDELHDPTLKWKGSSNQRVIDVQKSLKNSKVIEIE